MNTKVLVVYHNTFGKYIGKMMKDETIETEYVSNLEEGLIKAPNFDVVICDMDFPIIGNENILDENEAIETFSERQHITLNFIKKLSKKCIICAGYPESETNKKLTEIGVNLRVKYIRTPFNARILPKEINELIK